MGHDQPTAQARLLEVARDLYGLTPPEFIAARNAHVAQAKAEGDAQTASEMKALAKPSLAAWLVNLMVRELADPLRDVLELGGELRQAQADLDAAQLRALNAGRRKLLAAVVREGRDLAADHGHKVSEAIGVQVEATLQAAMTDPDAQAALLTGILTDTMSATGLGPVDLTGVLAVPGALQSESLWSVRGFAEPRSSGDAPSVRREGGGLAAVGNAAEVTDAERDLAAAQAKAKATAKAAAKANEALRSATKKTKKVEARVLQLRSEIEELRRQAFELEYTLGGVERTLGTLSAARDEAEIALARAEEAAEAAHDDLMRHRGVADPDR